MYALYQREELFMLYAFKNYILCVCGQFFMNFKDKIFIVFVWDIELSRFVVEDINT